MKKIADIASLGLLLVYGLTLNAQEYDYTKAEIKLPLPPTIILEASFKTYDIKLITSSKVVFGSIDSKALEARKSFEKDYLIPFANLQQVDTMGDFHIFILLQRFVSVGATATKDYAQKPNGLDFKTNIALYLVVSDRYGRPLFSNRLDQMGRVTHFNENWSNKDISTNEDLINKTIVTQAIKSLTDGYEKRITGSESTISLHMAYLNEVKKFPELKAMKDQATELKKALGKGVKTYIDLAAQYVPNWEKMTTFNTTKDSNEVKRAAYQNLVNYYILSGNPEKATSYLQVYKPIDKTTKEMMGLVRYKASEGSENLIGMLAPQQENITTADDGSMVISKETNADVLTYYTLQGSITIDDKKNSGTYTGIIKIKYPEPQIAQGTVLSLDATDASLMVVYVDGGQNKTLNSFISKITAMKDSFGKTYQTIKFGSALLGGSQYSLMRELFSSPKITTMKVIIPKGDDFLVKKYGDEKGVKSSLLNAKKNLLEYLQDCPAAVQLINSTKNSAKIPMEKLGAAYTSCQ